MTEIDGLAPARAVPAARVWFPPEDREWILNEIDACLASGQLTLGPLGARLEHEFASVAGTRHAVAVNSGTAALEVILRSLQETGRTVTGAEVLVPANTFFATAAAVIHAGAIPRFIDCDPSTMAIDTDSLRRSIGPKTVGVVVVHIGGLVTPAIDDIAAICRSAGLWLVEDAAHAHGSARGSKAAGSFGAAASFSFYPTKVIAGGEGGMITTDDEALATTARVLRDQGKASFGANHHILLGSNWRLGEPQAAIILSQLRRLSEFIDTRQRIATQYDRAMAELGLQSIVVPAGTRHNYYKYVVRLPRDVDRATIKARMRDDHRVSLSGEVYDTPLHRQPVFAAYADRELPGAEETCARHICLPISAVMTDEDALQVTDALGRVLNS